MKPTIKDCILVKRDLGNAVRMLENRMSELFINEGKELLESLKSDYILMLDCFKRGLRDPRGEDVYDNLLRRAYNVYNIVRLASIIKKRPAYTRCKNVAEVFNQQELCIKDVLEGFVQDVAMTSLLPDEERQKSIKNIYTKHQNFIDGLFNSIVVSEPWCTNDKTYYSNLLLSPTIDQNDAMAIVGAITIAILTVFDANKWLVLSSLYTSSNCEPVRQRALVGMMLTLPGEEILLYPQILTTIQQLCKSANNRREIAELQMQVYYCLRTEADNTEIQRDIMPTLIKNNNLQVTRNGIIEKDNSIDDILNSSATNRNMEEMESKMKKMMDMQKAGSDIYFGGFSQMKRFRFFNKLSNWFLPFNVNHPEVAAVVDGDRNKFIRNVLSRAPFCNSDCYSFAFALSSVADRLPDSIKEMMASNSMPMQDDDIDRKSPVYLRRIYLQDLYRFFMLYNERNDFDNPFNAINFETSRASFFANDTFHGLLCDEIPDILNFLFKQQQYNIIVSYATKNTIDGEINSKTSLLLAHAYLKLERYDEAYKVFKYLYKSQPHVAAVLKGLAYSQFMLNHYDEAANTYNKLMESVGKQKQYVICRSISLINSGHTKEGLADLFKLDYEDDTDMNVKRAIAWGYLMSSKPNEADNIYNILHNNNTVIPTDILNHGYAKWIMGRIGDACRLFKQYTSSHKNGSEYDITDDFNADKNMLQINGIKDYELILMAEEVKQS